MSWILDYEIEIVWFMSLALLLIFAVIVVIIGFFLNFYYDRPVE